MTPTFSNGMWYLNLTITQETPITVKGSGVPIFGCVIRPVYMTLSPPIFALRRAAVPPSMPLPDDRSLRTAGCSSAVSALFNANNVIITQTSFRNVTLLQPFANRSGTLIQDVSISSSTLVLLDSAGSLWYLPASSLALQAASLNTSALGGVTLDRLQTSSVCATVQTSDCGPSGFNDRVVAWSSSSPSGAMLLSSDAGRTWAPVPSPSPASAVLFATPVLNGLGAVAALLAQGATDAQIALYSWASASWTRGVTLTDLRRTPAAAECRVGLTASRGGTTELLAHGAGLYFSQNNGLLFRALTLLSRDPLDPAVGLARDECLTSVAFGSSGVIAALTTYRRLFVGFVGAPALFEVQSSVAATASAWVQVDTFGDVTIIEATGSVIQARKVPWLAELRAPLYPPAPGTVAKYLACPVLDWTTNCPPVAYLDHGSVLQCSVAASSQSSEPVYVSALVSNSSRLSSSVSTLVRPGSSGSVFVNFSVTVSELLVQSETRSQTRSRTSGAADLRLAPSSVGVTCGIDQVVTRVQIGCPPGRHIRVRGQDALSGGQAPCTATFRAATSNDDLSPNPSLYGSPTRVFHQTTGWKPTIDLYDGDVFVQEVLADFVVWEVTGRTDFGYTSSITDVGCRSMPPTWADFQSIGPGGRTWTADTHIPCWADDPSRPIVDGEYPLLNSSGSNMLRFPVTGDDGLFLFKARVVDPAFSHCELTARFAVNVFGGALPTTTVVAIIMGATGVLLLLLAGSFLFYRHELLKKDARKIE